MELKFDNAHILEESKKRVEEELRFQRSVVEKSEQLRLALDKVIPVLAKMGLEISGFSYRVRDVEDIHLSRKMGSEESNSLVADLKAVSTGKFKFISDRGYDSRGNSKNQERLDKKAKQISSALNEAQDLVHFSVNPYSLEISYKHPDGRVLISGYIK